MISALLSVVVGSLVLSAALTPLVYGLFLTAMPEFPWPYARVFNRVCMVTVFFSIVMLRERLRVSGIRELLRRPAGWPGRLAHVSVGCSISVLTVLTGILVMMWCGDVEVSKPWGRILGSVVAFIPAAVFISLLEELFFRGIMLDCCLVRFQRATSFLVVNAAYAIVHFVTPDRLFQFVHGDPWLGFTYLSVIGSRLILPGTFEGILALFFVGWILSVARMRSNGLYFGIGLHIGWILSMKAFTAGFARIQNFRDIPGLGRYVLLSHPLIWFSLLGALCLTYFCTRDHETRTPVRDH